MFVACFDLVGCLGVGFTVLCCFVDAQFVACFRGYAWLAVGVVVGELLFVF